MRTSPDPWRQQRELARTTIAWSLGSLALGTVMATRRDPWWRSFGQQHVAWGAVDLGIVAVVQTLQRREMDRTGDPYEPAVRERRRRHLRAILIGNAVADAGYVATGAVMCLRMRDRPRAAGAGAAIIVQGLFLLVHDAFHAHRSRPATGATTPPCYREVNSTGGLGSRGREGRRHS